MLERCKKSVLLLGQFARSEFMSIQVDEKLGTDPYEVRGRLRKIEDSIRPALNFCHSLPLLGNRTTFVAIVLPATQMRVRSPMKSLDGIVCHHNCLYRVCACICNAKIRFRAFVFWLRWAELCA